MKAIPALAVLLLSSCATRPVEPGALAGQRVPESARAVVPALTPVRDAAVTAGVHAETVARESRTLAGDVALAAAEANRLRMAAAVTAEEKEALWKRLTAIHQRAVMLADEAKAAHRANGLLSTHLNGLEAVALAKDAEAELLRMQYDDAAAQARASHELAGRNAKAAAELTASAENLRGQRRVWLGIAAGASALAVAFGYLAFRPSPLRLI